jgi:hypothetical protein
MARWPDRRRQCDSRWGNDEKSRERGMSAKLYLAGNNSCSFFRKPGDLMLTGPAGTGVKDASVVTIRPPTADSIFSELRTSLSTPSITHGLHEEIQPFTDHRFQEGRTKSAGDSGLPDFTFCESPRLASSSQCSCRRASSWTACSRRRSSYSATCTPVFRTQRKLLRHGPCKPNTSPFALPLVSLAQRAHGGTTSSPCEVVGAANGAGLVQVSHRVAS